MMPEEGSYVYIAVGSLSVYIWYNDKRLWSGGYNLSGSKLNLVRYINLL